MENLSFVVYWMNGKFWEEIIFSLPDGEVTVKEWLDHVAMYCGL